MKDSFLENLRKKNKREKQTIAWTASALITFFILTGWFVSAWNNNYFGTVDVVSNSEQNVASPLASLKENLDSVIESSFLQYQEIKKKFESEFFTEIANFDSQEYVDKGVLKDDAVASSSERYEYQETLIEKGVE